MVTLADRIKELRKLNNMTQTDLGKLLRVGNTTVSMYESGNSTPNDEIKFKMAEYFNVSLDYLLGKTNIKNSADSILKDLKSSNPQSLSKKDLKNHNDFMSDAKAMFMNDEVADEDKEKIFKDISDLFWESKKMNKEKYGRKKDK
ncbi:MAG: helix-turn-helix transcriptional regulator [Clostridium sp.]|uniref:helix-turn-helix domain-containing protein n=1 Tax=Clostridium sp. TaxID=1506 RepID=UPI003026D595